MTEVSGPQTATRRQVAGVALMFASNGALLASLLPWYPTLMKQWGITESIFGLVVAAYATGSIISSALPAPLVNRFGPLRVVQVGTLLMAGMVAAAGWSTGELILAIGLFMIGFFDAIVDVAQNVAGVRVEQARRNSIMSSMHAFWSLGAAAGGAIGTYATSHAIPIQLHTGTVAFVSFLVAVAGCVLVGDVAKHLDKNTTSSAAKPKLDIAWKVLPLVLIAIGGTAVEDIANNWAGLAATDLAGLDIGRAGSAFTTMLVAQCIGRFLGDPMINRWGRVRTAQLGGLFILAGGVLAATSSAPVPLYIGLALAGFGCATIVPSVFVAAAHMKGVSEGAGVTIVSWLMRLGFLGTSPLIGAIAEATNLRFGIGILIVAGATVLLFSPSLRPRAQ